MVEPPERHPDVDYEGEDSVDDLRADTAFLVEKSVNSSQAQHSKAVAELRSERRLALGIVGGTALVLLAAVLPFALIEGDGWRPALGFYAAAFLAIAFTGMGVALASRERAIDLEERPTGLPRQELEDILQEFEIAQERYVHSPWSLVALQERTAQKLHDIGAEEAANMLVNASRETVRNIREDERRRSRRG